MTEQQKQEAKEQLASLEAETVTQGLALLEAMVDEYDEKKFKAKCRVHHIEEQVKLAHRLRSLLG